MAQDRLRKLMEEELTRAIEERDGFRRKAIEATESADQKSKDITRIQTFLVGYGHQGDEQPAERKTGAVLVPGRKNGKQAAILAIYQDMGVDWVPKDFLFAELTARGFDQSTETLKTSTLNACRRLELDGELEAGRNNDGQRVFRIRQKVEAAK